MDAYRALMIGEKAPHFQANTTYGQIRFPEDYKGKWVVLFSHPGDFTPVCTTEIMTFASKQADFEAHNCKLLGLSVDSNPSHIEWTRAMERYEWNGIRKPKITFPIIADDFGNIARQYGMLMPASSATKTVRTVFIVDPEGTVRAILGYPLTTGRNIDEIMRLLLALQAYDETGNPTPCDWRPGDPQVLPPPQTAAEAQQRSGGHGPEGSSCLDWYLCFTKGGMPGAANKMAPEGMVMPNPNAVKTAPNVSEESKPAFSGKIYMPGANVKPTAPEMTSPAAKPAMPETVMPDSGMNRMAGMPNISVPPAGKPAMPEMSMPGAATNKMPGMPDMTATSAGKPTMPEMSMPGAAANKMPGMPDMTAPSAEKAEMPEMIKKPLNNTTASMSGNITPTRPTAPMPDPRSVTRLFTPSELATFDGKNGRPAYGVVDGVVYDLAPVLGMPQHGMIRPGTDLTDHFYQQHNGRVNLLNVLPVVGYLRNEGMSTRPLETRQPAVSAVRTQPPAAPAGRYFTLTELAAYNGRMGKPAYGAVNGVVYDIGSIIGNDAHSTLMPGTDMTREFNMCHMGMSYLLYNLPAVGHLR